jgi:HK97 gp10 family phage protein
MQITGLTEAVSSLKDLERKTQTKFVRIALRKGAGIIQKDARARAPHRTGTFAKSIRVQQGRTRAGVMVEKIGFNPKTYKKGKPYGEFEEEGHFTGKRLSKAEFGYEKSAGAGNKERYERASRAKGRTKVAGSHALDHAYESRKEDAATAFEEKLREQIAQVMGS